MIRNQNFHLCQYWTNWCTSEITSEFIMVGVSSIHVTKSFITWACYARPWAALFPSLRVCWTSTWRICCIIWMVLEILFAIVMGGFVALGWQSILPNYWFQKLPFGPFEIILKLISVIWAILIISRPFETSIEF